MMSVADDVIIIATFVHHQRGRKFEFNLNLDLAAFWLDEVVGLFVVAAEATASRGELLPMSHRLSL